MSKSSIEAIDKLISTAEQKVVALREKKIKRTEEIEKQKQGPSSLYPVLYKSIVDVARIADLENKSRPILNCVAIYKDAIYATNSYQAIRVKQTEGGKDFPLSDSLRKLVNKTPQYPILIPRELIEETVEGMKEITHLPILNCIKVFQDEKNVTLITNNLEREIAHRTRVIKNTSDKDLSKSIDSILPTDKEKPIVEVSFSLDYINRMVKAMSSDNTFHIKIYKKKQGRDNPAVVVSDNRSNLPLSKEKKIGLIMPLTIIKNSRTS